MSTVDVKETISRKVVDLVATVNGITALAYVIEAKLYGPRVQKCQEKEIEANCLEEAINTLLNKAAEAYEVLGIISEKI